MKNSAYLIEQIYNNNTSENEKKRNENTLRKR